MFFPLAKWDELHTCINPKMLIHKHINIGHYEKGINVAYPLTIHVKIIVHLMRAKQCSKQVFHKLKNFIKNFEDNY